MKILKLVLWTHCALVVDLWLGCQFSFQQDNDPKHKSKSVTERLKKNKITVLSWPSKGPDLNQTKNLWKELESALVVLSQKQAKQLEEVCMEE